MNIYVLDLEPKLCAQYHCDAHVVKQITEYCQILSTCHYRIGDYDKSEMLKPAYENHPVNVWVRRSLENYEWLVELTYELCLEFERRYKHQHTLLGMVELFKCSKPKFKEETITQFCQVMDTIYQDADVVTAYRKYYVNEKSSIALWRYSTAPEWYPEEAFDEVVQQLDTDYRKYILESVNLKK